MYAARKVLTTKNLTGFFPARNPLILEKSSEQSTLVVPAEYTENDYQQNQKPDIAAVVPVVAAAWLAAWLTAVAESSIVTHKKPP